MRRIASFEHEHRVADPRLDVKGRGTEGVSLELYRTKRIPDEIPQREMTMNIRSHRADAVPHVG
jgi:hypothetical protein